MNIRCANPADAPLIAGIQVAGWLAAYRGQMPDALLDQLDVSARAKFWEKLLHSSHAVTVAGEEDCLTGFCSVVPSRDQDSDSAYTAEIAAVYVHPQHWRRGAGRALCLAAFASAAAAGFTHITVWVLATNTPSIHFYEAMGFQRDSGAKSEPVAGGFVLHQVRLCRSLT